MEKKEIITPVESYQYEELSEERRHLVDEAREATRSAYAPYSKFHVGAAIQLADGTIVRGANQENASYPVTMCAERSACYNAGCNHKGTPMRRIAIAAWTRLHASDEAKWEDCFQPHPIAPCGVCRQALLEFEANQKNPIEVILFGRDETFVIPSVASLLPVTFTEF